MKIQTTRKVKYLITGNGSECKNDEFIKFCNDDMIIRHYATKGILQENGVAEE